MEQFDFFVSAEKYKNVDIIGPEAKMHHIGICVRSIADIFPDADCVIDEVQKVKILFVNLHGVLMELLEPLDETSPVYDSLTKRKFMHVCYIVPNINRVLSKARESDFIILQHSVPAPALGNKNIAWIWHKYFGVLELVEGI